MRCIFVLRAMVLFAIGISFFLQTKAAWSLELVPMGIEPAVSEDVSRSEQSLTAATQGDAQAPDQPNLPTADTSNNNAVVSIKEILSAIDYTFSKQRSDVEWASGAEGQVRALFRALTSDDTTLISVQCRTTLCRVEFQHATDAAFHNFLDALKAGVMAGWKGQMVGGRVGTNDARRVRSIFYLAKEGTDLTLGAPTGGDSADGRGSRELPTGH